MRNRYAQLVLAYLAALAPMLASFYVAITVVAEQVRAAHVARVYARIDLWFQPKREALSVSELGGAEYGRQVNSLNDTRRKLLAYNGLDTTLGTAEAFNRMMTPTALPALNIWRQLILITGGLVGVVLLSLDVATTGQP